MLGWVYGIMRNWDWFFWIGDGTTDKIDKADRIDTAASECSATEFAFH
jgi:hypothetical protein